MHRISLGNTEFEGRNNAYLLLDGDAAALVDTGVATPAVRAQLEAGLDDHGLGFADVDAVLLTHWHPDHAGLAGAVQAAGGATVHVHAADAPLVRGDDEATAALRDRQRERFAEWGMPDDKRDELLAVLDGGMALGGRSAAVEPFETGDELVAGGCALRVVHAPGHTAGSCCLEFDGESGREAFVGDVVLPVYTPNIGGADVRVDRPLAAYRDALETVIERGYRRAWPGHRDVIDDPAARCRTILDHHRERTDRVLDVLREHGPADAWTVSAHLFGDLAGIHIMHGPGEAFAHLDHLDAHGVVERTDEGYRVVPGVESRTADVL